MINTKTVMTAAALAVCCLASRADERVNDTPTARNQRDAVRTERPATADRDAAIDVDVHKKTTADRPYHRGDVTMSRISKASTLIGMEVKNAQNERLGTIKDLAFDIRSGRISYAVLSTGGVLGIGDKLVAIPVSAFQPASDEKHLVLNADRAKMESAVGFDKNNWPSMPSASWGADVNIDTDVVRPRNNAIEKRSANDPTVQELKRQAQERDRTLNPSTEPKRP